MSNPKRQKRCCCCEEIIIDLDQDPNYDVPSHLVINNENQLRSDVPDVPVHVPSETISSIANRLLSKPAIVQRAEQLVLPAYTDSGELRSNGLRSSLPVVAEEELMMLPPVPPPPPPTLYQFTSNYNPTGMFGSSCVDALTGQTDGTHRPGNTSTYWNALGYDWSLSNWDGVTTIDPCLPKEQIVSFVWPGSSSGNIKPMRGLEQLFNSLNPFADNSSPTVAEIDYWNTEVLKLFRRLLGLSELLFPVENWRENFLHAQISAERKHTEIWDERYPADPLQPYWGPCTIDPVQIADPHCGYGFWPTNPSDLVPYYNTVGETPVVNTGHAEGVFSANALEPWCTKFSTVIGGTLMLEGISGHIRAMYRRTHIGYSWKCPVDGVTELRVSYGGNMNPLLCV